MKDLQEELQEAKDDFNGGNQYSDDLEYKLNVADGKAMLMTKTLHASFTTLLQMTETLQMGASIAKTFVSLHERWPEKGRTIFNPYKRECDKLLKAIRTTNAAMEDVNMRFGRLEAYFPRSR